jgi:hypothetical protein
MYKILSITAALNRHSAPAATMFVAAIIVTVSYKNKCDD